MKIVSYYNDVDGSDDIPDNLLCPICTEVLTDPVRVIPCDHVFCRQCIATWLNVQADETCPMDRQRVVASPEPLEDGDEVVRAIESLEILCQCGWRGPRRDHARAEDCPMRECVYVPDCDWAGRVGPEEDMHRATCEFRRMACLYCARQIRATDYDVHVGGCLQSADLQDYWPTMRFGMSVEEIFDQMQSAPLPSRQWEFWPRAEEVLNYECRYFWKYIPFCGSLFSDSDILFASHAPVSYVCFLFKKNHGLAFISVRLICDPRFDTRSQIKNKLRRLSQRYGIVLDHASCRGYGTVNEGCHIWMGRNESNREEFLVEYVDPRAVPDNGRTYMPTS